MADSIFLPTLPLQTLYFSYQIENVKNSIAIPESRTSGEKDAKLQAACREMESLFIYHLLKEMRATIYQSGFITGGRAEQIYTSMLDSERAKAIAARGGIGLSKLLSDQLGGRSEKEDD